MNYPALTHASRKMSRKKSDKADSSLPRRRRSGVLLNSTRKSKVSTAAGEREAGKSMLLAKSHRGNVSFVLQPPGAGELFQ